MVAYAASEQRISRLEGDLSDLSTRKRRLRSHSLENANAGPADQKLSQAREDARPSDARRRWMIT